MVTRTLVWCGLAAVLALVSLQPVHAADPNTAAAPAPSREAREQMAAVHQKMAECLRSDRPFADCRAEMMTGCRGVAGGEGCGWMGGGRGMGPGMGRGMMRGGSPQK